MAEKEKEMAQTKKRADVTYVQAREAATGDTEDGPFVLAPGEIFAAEHPIVREHPHLFVPLQPSRDRPEVEQTTAAPGERRGRRVSEDPEAA